MLFVVLAKNLLLNPGGSGGGLLPLVPLLEDELLELDPPELELPELELVELLDPLDEDVFVELLVEIFEFVIVELSIRFST